MSKTKKTASGATSAPEPGGPRATSAAEPGALASDEGRSPGAIRGVSVLLALGLLASLLALFQWMELLVARAGGNVLCAVNATINCGAVWNSPFALTVGRLTGVPVAGWGLLWGVCASVQAILLVRRQLAGQPLAPAVAAVRLCAAVGAVACLVLAAVTASLGHLCLTCLATYLIVGGYAAAAFMLLPGKAGEMGELVQPMVGFNVAVLVPVFALLLLFSYKTAADEAEASAKALARQKTASPAPTSAPGQSTPPAKAEGTVSPAPSASAPRATPASSAQPGTDKVDLGTFLSSLPKQLQQAVSDSLMIYRSNRFVSAERYPARLVFGPATAPVKIIDFVDIRCGHCAQLFETLQELQRITTAGTWSLEPRHYPLDGSCNPEVKREGDGTSCLAAKALICLEKAPDRKEIEGKLFAEQRSLNKDKVQEIIGKSSMGKKALTDCMASQATAKALADDIAYASAHELEGTPLVVINGKKGTPVGAFLYALIVAGGDAKAPAFESLPPPRDPSHGGGGSHAGHGH